jgi:hypothetical protein
LSFTDEEERVLRVLLDNVDDLTEEQARAAILRLREEALSAEGEGLMNALPNLTPRIARRALEALAQRHFDLADDIGAEEARKRSE